jgi:hypothetical protein
MLLRLDGYCDLVCSDGRIERVYTNMSGMQTGFAFIGNPYYDCPDDLHWRRKDGETVIGCHASNRRARPVQDCYQELREEWAAEKAVWDEYERQQNAELADACHRDTFDATVGHLFDVQDKLMGIRLRGRDLVEAGSVGYGMAGGFR